MNECAKCPACNTVTEHAYLDRIDLYQCQECLHLQEREDYPHNRVCPDCDNIGYTCACIKKQPGLQYLSESHRAH